MVQDAPARPAAPPLSAKPVVPPQAAPPRTRAAAGADSDSDDQFDFAAGSSSSRNAASRQPHSAAPPPSWTAGVPAAAPAYRAAGRRDASSNSATTSAHAAHADDDKDAFDFAGAGDSPGAVHATEQRSGYQPSESRGSRQRSQRDLRPSLSIMPRAGRGQPWGGGGGTPSAALYSPAGGGRTPMGGGLHPPRISQGPPPPAAQQAPFMDLASMQALPTGRLAEQLLQTLLVNAMNTGGGAYDPTSCLSQPPVAPTPTAAYKQDVHVRSSSPAVQDAAQGRRSSNVEVVLPQEGGGSGSRFVALEATWKALSRSTDPTSWSVPALMSFGRHHIGTAKVASWWPRPREGAPKPPKHFWQLNPPRNDKASLNNFREVSAFLIDQNACLKRTLPDGVEVAVLHTSSQGVLSSGMGKLPSKTLLAVTFDHPHCMLRGGAASAPSSASRAGGTKRRRSSGASSQTSADTPGQEAEHKSKRTKHRTAKGAAEVDSAETIEEAPSTAPVAGHDTAATILSDHEQQGSEPAATTALATPGAPTTAIALEPVAPLAVEASPDGSPTDAAGDSDASA